MRLIPLLSVLGTILVAGCGGSEQQPSPTPAANGSTPAPATASNAQAATPDDWHDTDTLFQIMGGVQGKVVADVFVGDGYYTWKLLEAGARVISIDDDAANIAAMEQQKKARGIGDDRLLLRVTPTGTAGLLPNEADMVLCTRPFATINDRKGYFAQLRNGLKPPHRIFLVDFLKEPTPVGPPMDQRMDHDMVMEEVGSFGFTDVGTYSKTLPYRFVLFAQDFQEVPE